MKVIMLPSRRSRFPFFPLSFSNTITKQLHKKSSRFFDFIEYASLLVSLEFLMGPSQHNLKAHASVAWHRSSTTCIVYESIKVVLSCSDTYMYIRLHDSSISYMKNRELFWGMLKNIINVGWFKRGVFILFMEIASNILRKMGHIFTIFTNKWMCICSCVGSGRFAHVYMFLFYCFFCKKGSYFVGNVLEIMTNSAFFSTQSTMFTIMW